MHLLDLIIQLQIAIEKQNRRLKIKFKHKIVKFKHKLVKF